MVVRRFRWVVIGLVLVVLLGFFGCAHGRRGPAPHAGDCELIGVWSNGWHTSLAVPGHLVGDDHPLRRLFPEEKYFLIGWGAQAFYMDPSPGFWDGVGAALPPTSSVMHVIADDMPVWDAYYYGTELVPVAVSRAGIDAMLGEIGEGLLVDEDSGGLKVLSLGQVPGRSYFIAARDGFHLFNVCNHWTAARLRTAGADVRPRLAFHAPWLTGALRDGGAPMACPVAQ